MIKEMLNVLMDGIKDANMQMDYYDMAIEEDNQKYAMWFKAHAKSRVDTVTSDFGYICDSISLAEKARNGDVIADALLAHLQYEIHNLNSRYNAL